ncbi:MAG: flagellar assembly protein FliH [Betaproteobacteria bacterium]|nr:flagellar assembly protein FliH [Betaproteobacteria bacterium]MCL2885334.1 flagellar assembly protein FliH [Betaproteobacteria bacterium]
MIIPREELATFQRWQADAFDHQEPAAAPPPAAEPAPPKPPPQEETAPEPAPAVRLPTAEEIERMHEEAHAAGYAAGLAEGRAAAAEENRQASAETARQLDELSGGFKRALDQLEQTVADQLLALAVEIAAQVMRGQIAVREDVLLPIVREAIAALPLHHEPIVLRLNPADAANLRHLLGDEPSFGDARIVEDNSVSPGGCLLEAGASEIDARIETRWKRVLATIGASPQTWQPQP